MDTNKTSVVETQLSLIATKHLHQSVSVDLNTKDPVDMDEIKKLLEENTIEEGEKE